VKEVVHNPSIARGVAIFASYLSVLMVFLLIISTASKNIKQGPLSGVDRAVGVLFGLLRGIGVLVCFCFLLATFEVPRDKYSFMKNSKFTVLLFDLIDPWIPQVVERGIIARTKKAISSEEKKLITAKPPLIERKKSIVVEAESRNNKSAGAKKIKDFIRGRTNGETMEILPVIPTTTGTKQKSKHVSGSTSSRGPRARASTLPKGGKIKNKETP
jgi:uncharacterized membrane protein required for colicin V production